MQITMEKIQETINTALEYMEGYTSLTNSGEIIETIDYNKDNENIILQIQNGYIEEVISGDNVYSEDDIIDYTQEIFEYSNILLEEIEEHGYKVIRVK